jgi:hypothetical protein
LGSLAQTGIQFGAQGLIMKYSRTDEAQADAVGAIIMYKAGYNPKALADFFQKLGAGGAAGPQFLSDHPNPGNREAAIQKEIASWPPKAYSTSDTAFNAARQAALGVKAYSAQEIAEGAKNGEWTSLNKQSGAVFKAPSGLGLVSPVAAEPAATAGPVGLKSVLPSPQLVVVDLGALKIARPENWQVIAPPQKGHGLRIAPSEGVRGDAIAYGVLIRGVRLPKGQATDIDKLTADTVRSLQSGGDLTPASSARPVTVGGRAARSVGLESTSPFPDSNGQPQQERDWLVVVPQPNGTMLYFVFVAPQSEFESFRPSYESMLRSVQFRQ